MNTTTVDLSAEQNAPVAAALNGASLFLSGGAGTGKSATLSVIIHHMKEKYPSQPGAVAVIAPTGVAALNVGGTTIHSHFRFGNLNKEKASKFNFSQKPWGPLRVLIIDEISMVADWMLDLLDQLGRKFAPFGHRRDSPFGGIQVILCGDFLQLAPVDGNKCFHSLAWKTLNPMRFELTYAYRQGSDGQYARMLNEIRFGNPSEETLWVLNGERNLIGNQGETNLIRNQGGKRTEISPTGELAWIYPMKDNPTVEPKQDIEPTLLYPKNIDVESENTKRLEELPGSPILYRAQDTGPTQHLQKVSSWTNAPEVLALKLNAQVMLLRNLDIQQGLVNGSRGVVVGFGLGNAPVVRFMSGITRTLDQAVWSKEHPDYPGRIVATRKQYPLALAWASTVHKSQGQSLDSVHIDLSGGFTPPGMAYVALSRCRTLQGLSVSGLTRRVIQTDLDAVAFHEGKEQDVCSHMIKKLKKNHT